MAVYYDPDFLAIAEDTFGLTRADAEALYDDMSEELELDDLTVYDLFQYGDMASDLVEEQEQREELPWYEPLPPDDDDRDVDPGDVYDDADLGDVEDEWLDVGDEVEVTVEVEYDAVPS